MSERQFSLPDETATQALGEAFAAAIDGGVVIYLRGELGAGKTSFARALLRAVGVGERIKSPTYSLVESYQAKGRALWHLDLYRIADPGELEWLGLDALSEPAAIVLVEWAERGRGALPVADMEVALRYDGLGRAAVVRAASTRGSDLLARLA